MAVADQPSGLMDIASTLTQDEIPFKLRCAICNKLAVNAFRLPCCEQAICENCQASLPETCPVCAHTPISPDLCKPNKALRTTLKAFLRTEEKKRERDRPSIAPATPTTATPADGMPAQQEAPAAINASEENVVKETSEAGPVADVKPEEPSLEATKPVDIAAENAADADLAVSAESQTQAMEGEAAANGAAEEADAVEQNVSGEGDEAADAKVAQEGMGQIPGSGQMGPNSMGFDGNAGGFPNVGWSGTGDFNPMAQFMANGMFNNFPNSMGMPGMAAMDPMAASQGMLGGYGVNMNGMNNGMNMGMNFDASQGMYGGWDGAQNNMWNGGQDKFNPNAFANGMGPHYGGPSGFGGYNMSQPNGNYAQMQQQLQFSNPDFQNGFHGPGYGRANFRGRGRGFTPGGRGRGGYNGYMQANYPPNANYQAFQNQNPPAMNQEKSSQPPDSVSIGTSAADPSAADIKKVDDELAPGGEHEPTDGPLSNETTDQTDAKDVSSDAKSVVAPVADEVPAEDTQLRGIPTIDSIDEANAAQMIYNGPPGMPPHMGPPFGRGGYMRGPFQGGRGGGFPGRHYISGLNQPNMPAEPQGQGVEGAPAAPRAMREGLPNTSVLRQRGFQMQVRTSGPSAKHAESLASATPGTPHDDLRPPSNSRSESRHRSKSRSRTRSQSPSHSMHESRRRHRHRSQSVHSSEDERERRRDRQRRRSRRDGKDEEPTQLEEDRRSRSPSVDSLRRPSRRRDRERDRRSTHRSHRSHRHRSRSRSPSRNGESRHLDPHSVAPEENDAEPRDKSFVSGEGLEAPSRISTGHRSSRKDRSSRREEDKERDRESRRRDRDRDRERQRDRDRERHKDRDRDRRERDRTRDRKRSRRDRSESPQSDYSSHHRSRRAKRGRGDDLHNGDKDRTGDKPSRASEPEKDPHTLEREARNRERLLREQQRREAIHADRDGKSSRRRESRQDRTLSGGRRLSYKYEDEESDGARAARVEKEREASRWA